MKYRDKASRLKEMEMKKVLMFVLFASFASTAIAGNNDYVEEVYSCNDDVALKMKNAGWVVIQESVVGQKRLDRLMSIALTLVTSKNRTGYFNEGTPISWCGMSGVKPISVLAIRAAQ